MTDLIDPRPQTVPRALDVHVVTHTHWDREWYHPVGRFRQRLVALVDELLDSPPVDGASFLLDGQAIVVEDYLAVRPERRGELSRLLSAGRLEAGPWYVLADELIPSGEALVRNLLAGRRAMRALRAAPPPVLYCPDSFGHPAVLPSLARGFGFETVIAWRGYGGPRWPAGDAAWWSAPSGDRALLVHLPPDGYEFGSNLPTDADGARTRWHRMRAVLGARSRLGVVVVLNGADHHAPQTGHAAALSALVAAAAPDQAHASSLAAFADACASRARESDLPTVAGELRDSYGYAWTLQGTFGTRAAQKRSNALVERALVREAEPWAALARRTGGASRRPLVDAAWHALLACHPHDTLCGCSIDAVARAADARWEDAATQAAGVRDDALDDLLRHDPVAARTASDRWRPILVVRNAAARARSGIAEVHLVEKIADVGVGPASAGQTIDRARLDHATPSIDGRPVQVIDSWEAHERIESPRHYPDNDLVRVHRALAWVSLVPAYGLRCIDIPAGDPAGSSMGEERQVAPPVLRTKGDAADNEQLRLSVGPHGASLRSVDESWSAPCVASLIVRAERGDLYTPSAAGDERSLDPDSVAFEGGPLRATVRSEFTVPASEGGHASRVSIEVSIDAGSPFARIRVEGNHRGRDQRIRLVIDAAVPDARVWADAAFGPVMREALQVDPATTSEVPPPTAPLHRYVSLFGGARGATVYSDGLAEYEHLADGRVAVTLVRAVGELSRHDLPERPGHAGWPAPTPDAQCPGPFAAEFALLPHAGTRDDRTIALVERVADDALLPLRGTTLRSALQHSPPVHGVTLEGEGLAFSAMKDAEDGESVVLRCVNLLGRAVSGRWRVGFPAAGAMLARLDETPVSTLELSDGVVQFEAGPHAIVTVLVR